MSDADLYESVKAGAKRPETGESYGGQWFRKYEDGQNAGQNRHSAPTSHNETKQRTLKDFYAQNEPDSDLSEREDADIYEHYRRQQATLPSSEIDDKMKDFMEKLNPGEDSSTDMPRFQGFFNSMSEGVHPFEKVTMPGKDVDLEEGHEEQEEIEKELYRRELIGRLMGEKLTPRQFELISGDHSIKGDSRMYAAKDSNNDNFLDRRETIRLRGELAESERRRNVLSGEWTEEESHDNLKQLLAERVRGQPSPQHAWRHFAAIKDKLDVYRSTDTPERLLEKEYHFDEGLGESLQEHTTELKKFNPGMKVETRRDRDGFAIVKTTFAPEFKYNLDNIEADLEEQDKQRLSSLELILERALPGGA